MDFQFRDIERTFIERFGIEPEREAAFRSRLQHLQRRRIFSDLNTGRGKKASYHWGHVIQLMVTLDLIDLGMSPDAAVDRVANYKDQLIHAVRLVTLNFESEKKLAKAIQKGQCPISKTLIILTSAGVLSFAKPDGDEDSDGEYLITVTATELNDRLMKDGAIEPTAAFIDIGSRMMLVAGILGRLTFPNALSTAEDLQQWLNNYLSEDTLS